MEKLAYIIKKNSKILEDSKFNIIKPIKTQTLGRGKVPWKAFKERCLWKFKMSNFLAEYGDKIPCEKGRQ